MFRLGSFSHAMLRIRRINFVSASPVVLLIHVSAINREDVYPENNRGGTDEIYASDPEQSIWENEPNLNILGLSMDSVGQFERIKVINMQMHAYL